MTKHKVRNLLVLLIVVAIAVTWFVVRTPASPFDSVESAGMPSGDLIKQGEYVARTSDCVACHSTPDSAPFSGGLEMATPMGTIFTTNITPDKETGIGNYSLADFDRAVRQGVAQDGHRLYPAMPYPSYVKLSDDEVKALYAFFMQGVEPVKQANRESTIPWPLNMRWPIAFWNSLFTDAGSYQAKTQQDAQWNRGAYLVQGPGHCGSCHTPRGLAFNEKGFDEGSEKFLSGALLDGWYAPSLRGEAKVGLGSWSEADIYSFLKTGRNQHAVVYGSMTEAFNNSTQFMSDDDLHAIAHYLKSLPAADKSDTTPHQQASPGNGALPLSALKDHPGAQTFMARCASCHGAEGGGQGQWIPPLAGATSMMIAEQASAINVTLNGSGRIVANGVPDAYRMPPFRKQLSDKEVADVLSFIRGSWGNAGGEVKATDVEKLREHTDPASSNVIILQMR